MRDSRIPANTPVAKLCHLCQVIKRVVDSITSDTMVAKWCHRVSGDTKDAVDSITGDSVLRQQSLCAR